MPPDTPPSRVKKPWRMPVSAGSTGASLVVCVTGETLGVGVSAVKSRNRSEFRVGNDERLEQRAHLARSGPNEAGHSARDIARLPGGGGSRERGRPRLDAETAEEFTLGDRPMRARP